MAIFDGACFRRRLTDNNFILFNVIQTINGHSIAPFGEGLI